MYPAEDARRAVGYERQWWRPAGSGLTGGDSIQKSGESDVLRRMGEDVRGNGRRTKKKGREVEHEAIQNAGVDGDSSFGFGF